MRVSSWTIHKHSRILNIDCDFCSLVIMWLLARVNQTRLPRGTSLTLPPHLFVGSPISLLIPMISGNRETTPIYLSGYLSFRAKFAFFVSFHDNLLITPARLTSCCQSTHLLWWKLNSCKKLSGIGVQVHAQKKRTSSFWVCKVGEGRKEEHFLQFFEFCHSSPFLCYGFSNFKLPVFRDHFKYGHLPNKWYFKSSVHTGMSKEEAVFLKL